MLVPMWKTEHGWRMQYIHIIENISINKANFLLMILLCHHWGLGWKNGLLLIIICFVFLQKLSSVDMEACLFISGTTVSWYIGDIFSMCDYTTLSRGMKLFPFPGACFNNLILFLLYSLEVSIYVCDRISPLECW